MAESTEIPSEWYFITAPQNVSWSKSGQSSEIQTYATNNPYLHYGSTGLRQLTLGDAMIEGFSDGMQVEWNVIDLEAMMRVVLETEDGYAAPYCWEVYAGGKMYGTFIMDSVNVQEQIRDNAGLAARANVDISFKEVSPYQVSGGIDITAESLTGNLSPETQKQLMEKDKNTSNKQDQAAKDKNKENSKDPAKANGGSGSSDAAGGAGGAGGKGPDTVNSFWDKQFMDGGK